LKNPATRGYGWEVSLWAGPRGCLKRGDPDFCVKYNMQLGEKKTSRREGIWNSIALTDLIAGMGGEREKGAGIRHQFMNQF